MNVEKARKHLLEKGFVYSLRPRRRVRDYRHKHPYMEPLMWGGEDRFHGYVWVTFIKEIFDPLDLEEYVSESGFGSMDEWLKEAHDSTFLYRIELHRDKS